MFNPGDSWKSVTGEKATWEELILRNNVLKYIAT